MLFGEELFRKTLSNMMKLSLSMHNSVFSRKRLLEMKTPYIVLLRNRSTKEKDRETSDTVFSHSQART